MPRPLSTTRNIAESPSWCTLTVICPPGGVNFTALFNRFVMTCSMRVTSAEIGTGPGTKSVTRRRFFFSRTVRDASRLRRTRVVRSVDSLLSRICP